MMLPSILFSSAATPACNLATVNINDWIQINVLVLLACLSVGAVIYALAGLLANPLREKLKHAVQIEYTQGAISALLIGALISMAYMGCSIGAAMSGLGNNYQNIFQS